MLPSESRGAGSRRGQAECPGQDSNLHGSRLPRDFKSCPGGRAPNSNLHHARNGKQLRPPSGPPFRAVRASYRVRGGTTGGQRVRRGAVVALLAYLLAALPACGPSPDPELAPASADSVRASGTMRSSPWETSR